LIWYGQVFASMATWMDSVVRGWLIYELTNSSFQLGLVRGVQALPILLLSPIAGSTADLYSRKMQVTLRLAMVAVCDSGAVDPYGRDPGMSMDAIYFLMPHDREIR
jgi:MFS family permease